MRRISALSLLTIALLFSVSLKVSAQSCVPTNINGTVVNLSCGQTCTDMLFQIPHLKSTSTYAVNTIPYAPYPYIVAGGAEDATLYIDDKYSGKVTIPFPFCFYDSTFSKLVVGSNGLITFDTANAGCSNAYTMANTIPYSGGTICAGISPDYYPRSSIMGIFTDLNPVNTSSPADRKIQWRSEGTAPCRRFVVSFYHVGTFGDLCDSTDAAGNTYQVADSSNTFQIVIHESTGIVEVHVENKSCFSSTNPPGWGIMGVQNWNQNQAVAVPGRNLTAFTCHNEAYRYTPNGAISRFISCGLYTMAGTLVVNADTSTTTAGLLDVSFPNICPGANTQYVVKTIFDACPTGTQLISLDTIYINNIPNLTASSTTVPTSCGASAGTITATVTGNTGVPPYTYTISPPPAVGPATNNTGIFTNLAAGPYTITITDVNGCSVVINQTVTSLSSLAGTAVTTATSCAGVNNGTVTLTPQGVPPYSFTLTGPGGPYTQSSPVFTNLPAGTYNATYVDGAPCNGTISNIIVNQGAALTGAQVHSNTSCAGANDGTITITPTIAGSYTYTLSPGAITNTTGVFTGLAPNTYSVTFTSTTTGCSGTVNNIAVTVGGSITATWCHTAGPTCVGHNETCPGANDGVIVITPNAPGSYTFTINPAPGVGPATNTTGIFAGISPGIFYTVSFVNATGCTGSMTTLFVLAATAISSTQAHTDATCPGVNDGTITITPTPAGSYTYTLNPGAVVNTTGIFTGLAPNTYSVDFINAGGCGGTQSNIVIATGSGATATAATANTSCPGASDGTITITPPAVGGPFIYTLNPGAVVQNNNPVFTGLPTGTYTITFTTAAGCSGTVPTNPVIGAGAAPTATAVSTNAICPGVNNGTITITPPATGGPFVYTLNPGAVVQNNNPVFGGLAAGTYTITFTTATGCTGTVTTNPVITAGAAPTATAVAANATCPGVSDGTITITPPATGAPFVYTLNPGAVVQNNNPVYTGLAAGTYTITFTTAAGCSGTVPANPVVGSGAAPTATAVPANATCPGVNDGTITVTPPATGGPFIYTLNPGAVVQNNNPVFTGLATGTYTITFTTAAGCSGTVSPNPVVGAGSTPTATAVPVNATCPGVNNGTITVTPPATGGPFIYTLNPGNIIQNNNPVFTNLATGTYTITFTTSIGCSGSVSPNPVVGAGSTPTASAVAASATCPGVNDGTITVTPPATGGPFTYTLNPGNVVQNNNPVFTGLATGTYTITFTTSIGCSGSVSPDPVVGAGSTPTATSVQASTSCPGVDDGTITVTPPATGGPFIYILNPGAVVQNNNPVFTGLAAGTYTITFTTSIGCSGSVNPAPVVNIGAAPTATSVVTNTTCPGVTDGTITVVPPATGGPFVYTLNPGAVVQNNNPVFTGLAAGTYTISFTTSIGCSGVVTVNPVVQAGPPLTANTPTIVNPPCANINDGTLTIVPSLAGVYTYVLNPGLPGQVTQVNNPTFTGLAPGTYTYNFTNPSGCVGTGSATLTTHAPLAISVTKTQPLCYGDVNGIISLVASGGLAAYEYALSPFTTFQPGGTFNGLAQGTYTFRVRDAAGCIKDTTLTLGQPTQLTATAVSSAGTCNGNDGQILVTGHNGTPVYTYSVDGINFQAASAFTVSGGPNPGAAFPNITVKDINGCLATAPLVYVTLIDNMSPLFIGNDTTICAEQHVTFQPQVSPQANVFTWSTIPDASQVNTLDNNAILNATATPVDTTTYVLNAQWGVCSRIDTITINLLHKPIPYAGEDTAVCFDKTYAFLHGSATNLSGTVNYEWSDTTNLLTPHQSSTTATPPSTEIFTLTVTDNYGCNFSVTDQVVVVVQPPVPAFAGNDTIAVVGQPLQLHASGGVSYEWTPTAPLDFSNVQYPHATLYQDQLFQVRVTDVAGCIGNDKVFVQVYPDGYQIPNAFSPNGDGLNDVFRVIPAGIAYTEWFRIFNRYGQLVFETNQWLKGWDGTFQGKKQPIGNYVWVLKGVDKNNRTVELKGTIMLIQ